MYHVMLVLLTLSLLGMIWALVHSAPSALSRLLPPNATFAIGLMFLTLGFFTAFANAFGAGNARAMLGSFVQVGVGLWFMLSATAGLRGSEDDVRLMKRLFVMLGVAMAVIIGSLYLPDPRMMAALNLLLLAAGLWLTTNYLATSKPGR